MVVHIIASYLHNKSLLTTYKSLYECGKDKNKLRVKETKPMRFW